MLLKSKGVFSDISEKTSKTDKQYWLLLCNDKETRSYPAFFINQDLYQKIKDFGLSDGDSIVLSFVLRVYNGQQNLRLVDVEPFQK